MPQSKSRSVAVFSLEGKKLREIALPGAFSSEIEPELIGRAVLSIQSAGKQPQGVKPFAGRQGSAEYRGSRELPHMERGINVGRARLPRKKNARGILAGDVAKVPQAVGGPKAHPPKVGSAKKEKINRKEKKKALQSAIASCAVREMVEKRHRFSAQGLPVVVEDKLEELQKTREVVNAFRSLGVLEDVENARAKRKRRTGKGRKRGRKFKKKKSVLLVTSKKAPVFRAARNLEGVEVVPLRELNAELLAPGGVPGRLTVWSESAIKGVEGK